MRCRIGLQGNYVITVKEGQKAAQKDKGSRDHCYQSKAAHCGSQNSGVEKKELGSTWWPKLTLKSCAQLGPLFTAHPE